MSDQVGFAVDPADLRRAATAVAAVSHEMRDASRDLAAGLRALAAAVPGSDAAPAAQALATAWEAEGTRLAAAARGFAEALAETAADTAATEDALAGSTGRGAR